MAAKTASLSVNIIADAAKARAGLKEAETAFGRFSREVGSAQGVMGKFGAAGSSIFATVKANALGFATAGAAAIGAFAVKSVMDFQNLAIAAGKFSDATGLSTEQASRFIEVAGDFGIEAGAVEKSINFMNKTLGNSPDLFRKLGVEIAYASNGGTDVNATFLNVVRRLNEIEDPAQRAAMATKLLGRGWTEMSELVSMGASELAANLAAVSDAKVISPEERANAERLRAEVDRLRDSWENFANKIGSGVIPVLSDLLDLISDVGGGIGDLGNWISKTFGDNDFADNAKRLKEEQQFLNKAWEEGTRAQINARSESAQLEIALEQQRQAVEDARIKWQEFKDGLTIELQRQNLESDIKAFGEKWSGTSAQAKRDSEEYRNELLRLQIGVANFGSQILTTASVATQNKIRVLVETGQLERAVQLLQYINSGTLGYVNTKVGEYAVTPYGAVPSSTTVKSQTVSSSGASAPKAPAPPSSSGPPASFDPGLIRSKLKNIKGIATGGTITAGGMALVGEQGPELVSLPRGASVIPSIPSRKMMGGGTVVNVSVQAGLVSSPDQVGQQIIDAIRRAERRSGQVFAGI